MALATNPASQAALTHSTAWSCTLASHCAPVSGTSSLSVRQQRGICQCVQLAFAMRRQHELHHQCSASVSQSATRRRTSQPCGV